MRRSRAAGIGLLSALLLSGCLPSVVPLTPAEISATKNAEAMAREGRLDQAAQAYLVLASQAPSHGDHYRLLAAEAWRQEGQLDRAAPVLALIKREKLAEDEPVRLDLLRAELALKSGDAQSALQLTTQPTVYVPAPLQLRLLELRARAMAASGDNWGAARTRVEMDARLEGLDRTQNRNQIVDLLAKLGADPLKQRAAAMKPDDRMSPWIDEALARLGVAVAHAQPTLGQPVGTLIPGADANVREGFKMPPQVALLLPVGGATAAASNTIREGFFAAYADSSKNHAPRAEVRMYDSGGSGTSAIKAYQQAVADGAQLVVGPLTRSEVAAVLSQAQLPVPVLSLNHPDNKNLPANGTSEFGLLPETEGAQAADHMVERGIRNAYVLISGDDFAQRAASAFKAELAARGGQVQGSAQLSAGSVNYSSAIKGLQIGQSAGDAGIFISMRPQQARLLLPQLQVANVKLPMFATSHVYAGVEDPSADNDLEGLEFCDAPWLFDAQPGLPSHADIAIQLPETKGVSARLFAFGMDAWNLAPYLDWLRAHPGSYLPGASGQLTADQFGRIRRVLVWAKFQGGVAHPLSGSLQMDDVPASAPPVDDGTSAPPPDNGGTSTKH